MGGTVDLLEIALRVPPWEPLYRLSAEELRRVKLSTVETLFERDREVPQVPPATSTLATVGQPGLPRD
jgi:hypothetical protein